MIDYELRRGGLTADPELRFTNSGQAVCNFTLAQSHRKWNEETQQWDTVRAHYIDVTVWDQRRGDQIVELARICAETLKRGDKVTVHGSFSTRSFEDREGNKRSRLEFTADAVALDVLNLNNAPAPAANNAPAPAAGTYGGNNAQPPF